MNRFRNIEDQQAAARAELPSVAIQWLAALRSPLEQLTMAAVNGEISDAEFHALVEKFTTDLPALMDSLDHDALASHMENNMSEAMINGILQRVKDTPSTVKGKAPEDSDALNAARKYKQDDEGQFSTTDGSGRTSSSRKKLRKKPTLKEKKETASHSKETNPERQAVIDRYRKGIYLNDPTGRSKKTYPPDKSPE